jgi:predicted DCC family thiol-disulfide oxidoreductase YuxK
VGSNYPIGSQHDIIFFDGICNLCNGAVNTIIKFDKYERFKFASLQSDFAKQKLTSTVLAKFDSIILLKKNQFYYKSDAIIEIAKELPGFRLWMALLKIFPRFMRDFMYDIVARHRYKFFGKLNACNLPTPELIDRFLY